MHRKSDVGRLYILVEDGGGGLVAIEDCVESALRYLEVYVHGSERRLIKAARGDRGDGLGKATVLTKAKKEKKLKDWAQWRIEAGTEILIVVAKNQGLKTSKA